MERLLVEALRAVAFPAHASHFDVVYPTPESLAPAQRTVIEVLCDERFGPLEGYAMPYRPEWRRQWFRAAGMLEKTFVEIEHAGTIRREPLWRALQITRNEGRAAVGKVFDALPFATALEAIAAVINGGDAVYKLHLSDLFGSGELRLVRELQGEGRAWAESIEARPRGDARHDALAPFVFLALVRCGAPIDRAREAFFPSPQSVGYRGLRAPEPTFPRFDIDDYLELANALPEGRRVEVLAPHLNSMRREWLLALLERFPSTALAKALLDAKRTLVEMYGSSEATWSAWVDDLTRLAEKHPEFLPAVQASIEGRVIPLDLYVLDSVTIDDASRLDDVQRRQLQRVGQLWDGEDLPLSERVGRSAPRKEPEDGNDSFLGSVEFRQIGDARGKHLYDALLYGVFAGTIFEAGSAKDIGYAGDQIGVKLHHDDVALRLGLKAAIAGGAKRWADMPRAASTKKSARSKATRRTPRKR